MEDSMHPSAAYDVYSNDTHSGPSIKRPKMFHPTPFNTPEEIHRRVEEILIAAADNGETVHRLASRVPGLRSLAESQGYQNMRFYLAAFPNMAVLDKFSHRIFHASFAQQLAAGQIGGKSGSTPGGLQRAADHRVFVRNCPPLTDDELTRTFSMDGRLPIMHFQRVSHAQKKGRPAEPTGQVVISYPDTETAHRAIEAFQNLMINGEEVYVESFRSRAELTAIEKLVPKFREALIECLFLSPSPIEMTHVTQILALVDPNFKPKNYGFKLSEFVKTYFSDVVVEADTKTQQLRLVNPEAARASLRRVPVYYKANFMKNTKSEAKAAKAAGKAQTTASNFEYAAPNPEWGYRDDQGYTQGHYELDLNEDYASAQPGQQARPPAPARAPKRNASALYRLEQLQAHSFALRKTVDVLNQQLAGLEAEIAEMRRLEFR
eukprot:TRINITY_DN27547_c0_g1_i1.p1 TRINITY_DN27547_c0_g1~~TRINITY_DN27547_c0_g1_i1.p1  ORF type:complete len:434 (+),score=123.57 TRINITY_DN27547_c0_g1_i1:622-1923(+)